MGWDGGSREDMMTWPVSLSSTRDANYSPHAHVCRAACYHTTGEQVHRRTASAYLPPEGQNDGSRRFDAGDGTCCATLQRGEWLAVANRLMLVKSPMQEIA